MAIKKWSGRRLVLLCIISAILFGSSIGIENGQSEIRAYTSKATPHTFYAFNLTDNAPTCLNALDGTDVNWDGISGTVRTYIYNRADEIGDGVTFPDPNFPGTTDKVGTAGASATANCWITDLAGMTTEWAVGELCVFVIDKINLTTGAGYTTSINVYISGVTDQYLEVYHRIIKIPTPAMTSSTSTSITLSWTQIGDDAGNVWGYSLYRAQSLGGEYAFVDYTIGLTNTTYTDNTVQTGQTYYYKLSILYRGQPCPVESLYKSAPGGPYVVTDTTPPTITHTPITSAFINTEIIVNATIVDASGIKEAKLWYKGVNASEYFIAMSNETIPSIYSATIPAQAAVGNLYYYINATDNYNNSNQTQIYSILISAPAGYISGRVINSTNETEGIASANVTVFNETFSNSSLTNATGYFNITVPPGDYTIKAKKQHYWRDERPVKVEHAKPAENVTLALYYDATAPVIDLNTANPPNGSIITDSTPVISINYTDSPKGEEGIDVESVILKINNRAVAPTITNKSVTYNPPLSGLDDGEYTVYVELRDRAGNPCNASWSFTIITKGTVKGFVKDSYGNAIRGATVELLSETATVKSTATDQHGSYEFLNIRKGRYWVRVTADELQFKAKTVLIEPLGIAWANFTAEAVRNYIFGYVIDENNNPVVGAKVTASSPYYTAHAYTNLSGYYKILGLPVGIYNLTAERSGYQTGQRTISLTQEEPLEQVFVLAKSPELVAPAQKKPAFIPDVSIAAAILALILIAGVNTLRHRFRRKISI